MKLEPTLALGSSGAVALAGAELAEAGNTGAVLCALTLSEAALADRLAEVVGCPLPRRHGQTTGAPSRRGLWLSPRSWIVLCPAEDEVPLVRAIAEAFPGREVHAACHSDALCWLRLSGDRAEDLLREGCFLSLGAGGFAPGFARRTLLADIPAILLRESATAWLIGVERSRARYLATWLSSRNIEIGDAS